MLSWEYSHNLKLTAIYFIPSAFCWWDFFW